jgi:signal transduction histidine kinase
MPKIDLRSRLFLSHLLVLIVGVSSLVIIGKLSSPRYFVFYLEELQARNYTINYAVRTYLIDGFEAAWNHSTFWAVIAGSGAAGGLSYWMSQRIVKNLTQMENITQRFAAGDLAERLPTSEIPEIHRLSMSFNRMAASLAGVEERRREIIGDLTHELRTPLTVVQGYLEELADEKIPPTPEIYTRLLRETQRLQRLVNDVQELSKAEAGYLPIDLQPVQVYPLLNSLVERFRDQLINDEPMIILDCSPHLPPVLADIDRLEQVLVNLLGNALNYTRSGKITIQTSLENRSVYFAIIDTGLGIAPEDLPHIFDRFWRGTAASELNYRGTGIGLAICRRLIELQGGEISVTSQLGQGSTFQFHLPLA